MALVLGRSALAGDIGASTVPMPPPLPAALPAPLVAPAVTALVDADQPLYAVSTRRDRIGRIIAPVMINGRGPFLFMLDTGATRTAVSAPLLAALGVPQDANTMISVQGVSGSLIVATAHIDSLDVGELHFRDLTVPVLAGPVLEGIDGILGMDGLANKKISADFIRDRITIKESGGQRAAFKYSVIPVKFLSMRLLMADGFVGNVKIKIIIDTGGMRTLGNRALLDALAKDHHRSTQNIVAGVIDATQALQKGVLGRVPTVKFGVAEINNLDVTFGDFHVFAMWNLTDTPALLVGMDVLGTLEELTIDYRRKELQVLPRPS